MADDGELSAVEEYDATRVENKRKFDDAGVVVAVVEEQSVLKFHNNAAGSDGDVVSAAAAAAPVSYNNVAPPMSEFELAKQRAELIAARLVTGAELKRPRTDDSSSEEQQNGVDGRANGTEFDQGFPGNRNKLDIFSSFGIPVTMCRQRGHLCACFVAMLLPPVLNQSISELLMSSLVRRACCCFQNAAQIRLIFPQKREAVVGRPSLEGPQYGCGFYGWLQIPIKRTTSALQTVVLNNCFSISSSIILSSSNIHLLKITSNLSIIIIRGMEAHNQGRWMSPTPRYNNFYSKLE
jgi:hypothetical protein